MKPQKSSWDFLKKFTQARIGLQRSGHAIHTQSHLDFQRSHAQARDAIFKAWDYEELRTNIENHALGSILLQTQAKSREEYLRRPDYGRKLDKKLEEELHHHTHEHYDILILISNGLSSEAMHKHAYAFLKRLLAQLKEKFSIPNVFLAENARVALIDDLGSLFKAPIGITLIGERPGLSSSDSMGLYLTYKPEPGKTDAERNCISNIREPHGLSYEEACEKTFYLLREALKLKSSGIHLKEETRIPEAKTISKP